MCELIINHELNNPINLNFTTQTNSVLELDGKQLTSALKESRIKGIATFILFTGMKILVNLQY
jgi:hypothetical protein